MPRARTSHASEAEGDRSETLQHSPNWKCPYFWTFHVPKPLSTQKCIKGPPDWAPWWFTVPPQNCPFCTFTLLPPLENLQKWGKFNWFLTVGWAERLPGKAPGMPAHVEPPWHQHGTGVVFRVNHCHRRKRLTWFWTCWLQFEPLDLHRFSPVKWATSFFSLNRYLHAIIKASPKHFFFFLAKQSSLSSLNSHWKASSSSLIPYINVVPCV